MSFENKVVIVTGASSGIGVAIAHLFAKETAQLVITGRDITRLKKTAEECEKISGQLPLEIVADLAKEVDVGSIVSKSIQRYGKIDILVNNAAIFIFKSIEEDIFMKNFDNHIAVNVRAPLQLMKDAAPYLIETKGNVVNISSMAGFSPCSTGTAYCSSKAALDHASRCIALDLASKGVRINTVSPGPVFTKTMENSLPKEQIEYMKAQFSRSIPLQKPSESAEIADLVAYLASDKARSVTGANFNIDCGCGLKGLASLMETTGSIEM